MIIQIPKSIKILTGRQPDQVELVCLPPTGTTDEPGSSTQQAEVVESSVRKLPLHHALRTSYGLQIRPTSDGDGRTLYVIELISPKESEFTAEVDNTTQKNHYIIFPDWNTSFIWNDPESFKDAHDFEESYPAIATIFSTWRYSYNEAFQAQGIHMGEKGEVFPSVQERVAWCTEGFLLSCWVVLQDHVETVKYRPEGKSYELFKENLSDQFELFGKDMDALF